MKCGLNIIVNTPACLEERWYLDFFVMSCRRALLGICALLSVFLLKSANTQSVQEQVALKDLISSIPGLTALPKPWQTQATDRACEGPWSGLNCTAGTVTSMYRLLLGQISSNSFSDLAWEKLEGQLPISLGNLTNLNIL